MKNFLLYFGSGRAGSTWLHGELSRRSDCGFAPQKELFIFQKFFSTPNGFDRETYFEFFAELSNKDSVKLLGDITPSNAYANKEQLYWFKENADKYSFNVLPMMTLRDPVSYIISLSKLQLSANEFLKTNSPDKIKSWFIQNLFSKDESWAKSPTSAEQILTECRPPFERQVISWQETVNNVVEVFGDIHFNFYETLFEQESLTAMYSYLGLDGAPTNKTEKVFSFGEHPTFSEDEKLKLFTSYPFAKENYDFAVERFGKEFIETIWWSPYK